MTFAAFLPLENANYLCRRLPGETLFVATSWAELTKYLSSSEVDFALVDPSAEGYMNIAAVARVLTEYSAKPVVAYVTLSAENLKAALYLSSRGLHEVFLHPDDGKTLSAFAHRLVGDRLAYEFLVMFETRLARLPPSLMSALKDLFERPHRYETAADIGMQSGVHVKSVYRAFNAAGIGTPRKLVTAAKLLRSYAYLRQGLQPVGAVSREVGYSTPRLFSKQVTEIFGCSPTRLRKETNTAEISAQLVEWLYKPRPRMAGSKRALKPH